MTTSLRFFLEDSNTPIYKRIINCLTESLNEKGHEARISNPQHHDSIDHYIDALIQGSGDYALITNPYSIVASYIASADLFTFELLPCRLIFLHHENCITQIGRDESFLTKLFMAYQKTSGRSHHFCIEASNCDDLRQLGLQNVYPIHHASEFSISPQNQIIENGTTFVGHVLDLPLDIKDKNREHLIKRDYWGRICDLSHSINASAKSITENKYTSKEYPELLAIKGHYIGQLHDCSILMRAEILKRVGNQPIDIFGGDPSYLHGYELLRKINDNRFTYHPPTISAEETAYVYHYSHINLNITSFQFDTAVINRVIDIGAAGGFPLTDWKEDLAMVTSVHKEISYKSPEELRYKIEYYSRREHFKERLEICHTLHDEIQANYTYCEVVEHLLGKLNESPESSPVAARA
jgi:hypothetical protein